MTGVWRDAALDAWDALCRDGTRSRDSDLEFLNGPGLGPAPLWSLVHVLWAAAEVMAIGGSVDVGAFRPSLRRLRSGDAYAATPGGRRFFDDNAWLGLASLRLLGVTGDDTHRRRATRVALFVRRGRTAEGAIRWAERSPSRNACSTTAAAWLVLDHGGLPQDRAFAERAMTWLDRTLRRPDGLVADRVVRGKVVQGAWSYNQGAAIAVWRRLDRADLADALSEVALARFADDRLWREPPAFSVIFFRALLERPTSAVTTLLDAYLERLVNEAREPSGWYTGGGVGTYDGDPTIDQAAVVQLLALRGQFLGRR